MVHFDFSGNFLYSCAHCLGGKKTIEAYFSIEGKKTVKAQTSFISVGNIFFRLLKMIYISSYLYKNTESLHNGILGSVSFDVVMHIQYCSND